MDTKECSLKSLDYPDSFVDISSEAAALGSMILDKENIPLVQGILKDEFYFHKPEHRHIFNAIISVYQSGSGMDCLLVKSALEEMDRLTAAGGVDYLVKVAESTPTAANAEFYAKKVLDKYRLRLAWEHTQRQQNILKTGGSWKDIEKELRQDDIDYADSIPADNTTVNLLSCNDIQTSEIEWLWENRIPLGMFNLLAGNPGVSKSFLTCYIAATISQGRNWPDGMSSVQGSTFILNDEDPFDSVIVPRLKANNADLSKIFPVNELAGQDTIFNVSNIDHLQKMEKAIEQVGDCRLIIFDPITSFLGDTNANSNSEVRQALGGLVRLAQRKNVCIIGISHLSKKAELDVVYRSLGSMAFTAISRSVWGVCLDKNDPETRIFAPVKTNLSVHPKGLSYTIEDMRLQFDSEPVEQTLDEIQRESPAKDAAIDFLNEVLSPVGRLVEQVHIIELAKERKIRERTLYTAKKALKIVSIPQFDADEKKHYFWRLKDNTENE